MPLGIAAGPDGNVWFTDNGTTKAIGVIDLTTHAISEFRAGLNAGSSPQQGLDRPARTATSGSPTGHHQGDRDDQPDDARDHRVLERPQSGQHPGRVDRRRPGRRTLVHGRRHDAGDRTDRPDDARDQRVRAGLNPGANLGRIAVGPDGNIWFGDKGTTPSIGTINPTTHAITQYSTGLNAGSLPGGIWTGSDGNVWFTDQGAIRAIGRVGVGAPAASVTPPAVTGSGGVGVPQSCGGDTWSTWAGQQPSHSAYGFDGYQWLLDGSPIAGADRDVLHADVGRCRPPALVHGDGHLPLLVVTVSATSARCWSRTRPSSSPTSAAAVAGVGPGESLAAKVAAIEGYVAADDTADACATLGAFINEVNAQTGKKISTAQAASFIAQAQDIEAALGC